MTKVDPTRKDLLAALRAAQSPWGISEIASEILVRRGITVAWGSGTRADFAAHLATLIRVGVLRRLVRDAVHKGTITQIDADSGERVTGGYRPFTDGLRTGYILTKVHRDHIDAYRRDRKDTAAHVEAEHIVLRRHLKEVKAEYRRLTAK